MKENNTKGKTRKLQQKIQEITGKSTPRLGTLFDQQRRTIFDLEKIQGR